MDFFLLGNSNNYWVQKLRDETGALVDDATVTLEIFEVDEETGELVSLDTGGLIYWPLVFVNLGRGDYRVHLPPDLPLEMGKQYKAVIEAEAVSEDAPSPRYFKETRDLYAKQRLTV